MNERSIDGAPPAAQAPRRRTPLWAGALGVIPFVAAQITMPWSRSAAPFFIGLAISLVFVITLIAWQSRRQRA